MQGRLKGQAVKSHFLEEVASHGAERMQYLLAVDVDIENGRGLRDVVLGAWHGAFLLKTDLATLRPVPWQEGTADVPRDIAWEDGYDVVARRARSCARSARMEQGAAGPPTHGTELESWWSATATSRTGARPTATWSRPTNYNVDYFDARECPDRSADPYH